jgi:hypothetical protein
MTKEQIKLEIKEKLTEIAFYMQTTMAFPLDYFELQIEGMNLLEQLAFVNNFSKRHPKVISPIIYEAN